MSTNRKRRERDMVTANGFADLSLKGRQDFPEGWQCQNNGVSSCSDTGLRDSNVWIDLHKGRQLLGISMRTLRYRCQQNNYVTKTITANGGKQYRILLSSLPIEAQMAYWRQALPQRQSAAPEALPSPVATSAPVVLPERERQIALAWADLLKLYLATCETVDADKVSAKKQFVKLYNQGAFPNLFKLIGTTSYKSMERKKKEWLDAGKDFTALAPKHRLVKRSRTVTQAQAKYLLAKALSPNRLRVAEAVREAREVMLALGVACDQSDMTYRRWLDDWKDNNYDIWQLCRYGEKRLNDIVLPFVQRDYSAIQVGDIAVADGHVLNFEVINPFTGKPKRMTLIVLFDMKSNYPLGWEIMPTENVRAIAAAFRRGILNLGFVPRIFYLDNGKAFRSKYFKGVEDFRESGLTGLFERLNCSVIHAWAYHGQSKTVERMFGSFGEMERLAPSYTGTSIDNKPARMQRNEKWHIKMWERIAGGATPTLEEAHWMVAMWFARYVEREQQDGHLKGLRPAEVFAQGVAAVRESDDFHLRVKTREELAYLMMSQKVTKLYRNGIRFNGHYYYHEALFPYSKERSANQFIIHYDLENTDSVMVFSETGEFVCEAFRTDKVHPAAAYLGTDKDVKALQEQIEHKRTLAKGVKQTAEAFFDSVSDDLQKLPETPQMPAIEAPRQSENEDPPALDISGLRTQPAADDSGSVNVFDLRKSLPVAGSRKERKIYLFETDKDIDEMREERRKAEGL